MDRLVPVLSSVRPSQPFCWLCWVHHTMLAVVPPATFSVHHLKQEGAVLRYPLRRTNLFRAYLNQSSRRLESLDDCGCFKTIMNHSLGLSTLSPASEWLSEVGYIYTLISLFCR